MRNFSAENWKVLGRWVQTCRLARGHSDMDTWAQMVGRSTRQLQGLERGERVGPKTLENVAKALGVEVATIYEVLESRVSPALDPGPVTTNETLFQRLSRRADEAQAEFENAVAELVSSEAKLDAANRQVFGYLALDQNFRLEVARREEALGRPLTEIERLAIDSVERPSSRDVAELIATHAEMDPHEWTRYEMALMEHFYGPQESVTSGSRFADLGPARAMVARLEIQKEGGDDGTQTSTQKTDGPDDDDLGGVTSLRPRGPSGPPNADELSEPGERLPSAADRVNPDVDEELGGSR